MFAAEESEMKPEDGVAIMDAKICILRKKAVSYELHPKIAKDVRMRQPVSLRSEESGVAL